MKLSSFTVLKMSFKKLNSPLRLHCSKQSELIVSELLRKVFRRLPGTVARKSVHVSVNSGLAS